jgi:phospholipase/carboxylesterase
MADSTLPFRDPLPAAASDDGSAIRIGPERADCRLVLLHGWGADADDLLDLGETLVGPLVSVVALRAPMAHPAGTGRQWYDLMPEPQWQQLPGARLDLRQRLAELAGSVPLARTALLGFSQGAAMALDVATGGSDGAGNPGEPSPLAALIACSGYPHPDWIPRPTPTAILLTHGEQDPMVPFAASEALEQRLRDAGGSVRRVAFNGGHGIDPELFPLMRSFLASSWPVSV